jgi:hypothetical protein
MFPSWPYEERLRKDGLLGVRATDMDRSDGLYWIMSTDSLFNNGFVSAVSACDD